MPFESNDSIYKKRLFACWNNRWIIVSACGDYSLSQIVYACVDNLTPTILLMPTNWSNRIHHTIILLIQQNDNIALTIIPHGITISKVTLRQSRVAILFALAGGVSFFYRFWTRESKMFCLRIINIIKYSYEIFA